MNKRVLIAGNWKMNKTPAETEEFISLFTGLLKLRTRNRSEGVETRERETPRRDSLIVDSKGVNRLARECDDPEVLLLPPFTSLDGAGKLLANTPIGLGAQNVYFEEAGAFTGEISAEMLRSCGCRYALVGHSERRTLFREDDPLVNRKLSAALAAGLHPILCVGETLEEHRQGRVEERITSQLIADLGAVDAEEMASIVIAYEPIWAIGTGETASPEEAEETICLIRGWIADTYDERRAAAVRVLYGGSVNPENTASLIAQSDIDGVLVGGASLDPDSFARIVTAACSDRWV